MGTGTGRGEPNDGYPDAGRRAAVRRYDLDARLDRDAAGEEGGEAVAASELKSTLP
jgi:hypothetical protein